MMQEKWLFLLNIWYVENLLGPNFVWNGKTYLIISEYIFEVLF